MLATALPAGYRYTTDGNARLLSLEMRSGFPHHEEVSSSGGGPCSVPDTASCAIPSTTTLCSQTTVALVGFQGHGLAEVIHPHGCHPCLLGALLFQWSEKGSALLGQHWRFRPRNPRRAYLCITTPLVAVYPRGSPAWRPSSASRGPDDHAARHIGMDRALVLVGARPLELAAKTGARQQEVSARGAVLEC